MSALLSVEGLVKEFRVPAGIFGSRATRAVDDVTLGVERSTTLGLVGESGSGKTTLARCVLGLVRPTSGTVTFDGADVAALSRSARRDFRRRVQPVFQDPFASLDPRWSVGRSVAEALVAHRVGTASDRERRVADLLEQVGLPPASAHRMPATMSGGQRQRVGIAAALASGPDLIVADEPVSALDVSVQAQVLNLFARLQRETGVAVLFVSHDLAVVEHVSDHVAVMRHGRLLESAGAAEIFASPRHPYTRELLAAVPAHPRPTSPTTSPTTAPAHHQPTPERSPCPPPPSTTSP